MRGAATDLSARLWDERALLARLLEVGDRPDDALPVLDRLRSVRLERDVLVHALADPWYLPADSVGVRALAAATPPPPWDLIVPEHLAALDALDADLDRTLPPGAVRDRWERLRVTPRGR